jgi:hypothetical protein
MTFDPGDLALSPDYRLDESGVEEEPEAIVVGDPEGRPVAFFSEYSITRAGVEGAGGSITSCALFSELPRETVWKIGVGWVDDVRSWP